MQTEIDGKQPKDNYVKTVNGTAPDINGNIEINLNGGGTSGIPGVDGEDGGYYTPKVLQVNDNIMKVSFTASKEGMATVED